MPLWRGALRGHGAAAGRSVLPLQALPAANRRGSVPAGGLAALTRQAHKIKGAARLVGAVELAETAGQLEAAGRAEEWPAVLPLAAGLATAVERLRLYVGERYPASE